MYYWWGMNEVHGIEALPYRSHMVGDGISQWRDWPVIMNKVCVACPATVDWREMDVMGCARLHHVVSLTTSPNSKFGSVTHLLTSIWNTTTEKGPHASQPWMQHATVKWMTPLGFFLQRNCATNHVTWMSVILSHKTVNAQHYHTPMLIMCSVLRQNRLVMRAPI